MAERTANHMRAIDVLRTAGLAEDVTGAYFVEFPLGRGRTASTGTCRR